MCEVKLLLQPQRIPRRKKKFLTNLIITMETCVWRY